MVFTLSFGGTDFSLKTMCGEGNAADAFSISKICNGEIVVDLHNFVGTLHVKRNNSHSDGNSNRSVDAGAPGAAAREGGASTAGRAGTKRAVADDGDAPSSASKSTPPPEKKKRRRARGADASKKDDGTNGEAEERDGAKGADATSPSSSAAAARSRERGSPRNVNGASLTPQDRALRLEIAREVERRNGINAMMDELVKFREAHGHCNVPQSEPITQLGLWVKHLRAAYNLYVEIQAGQKPASATTQYSNVLTLDLIQRLDGIGFHWGVQRKKPSWESNYELLKKFAEENGHCSVPRTSAGLAKWAAEQRHLYKKRSQGAKSAMTDERIEKLNGIGFEWRVRRVSERTKGNKGSSQKGRKDEN